MSWFLRVYGRRKRTSRVREAIAGGRPERRAAGGGVGPCLPSAGRLLPTTHRRIIRIVRASHGCRRAPAGARRPQPRGVLTPFSVYNADIGLATPKFYSFECSGVLRGIGTPARRHACTEPACNGGNRADRQSGPERAGRRKPLYTCFAATTPSPPVLRGELSNTQEKDVTLG